MQFVFIESFFSEIKCSRFFADKFSRRNLMNLYLKYLFSFIIYARIFLNVLFHLKFLISCKKARFYAIFGHTIYCISFKVSLTFIF